MSEAHTKRRIVVVGGGTAGWMAAALAQRRFAGEAVEIIVIDSSAIPAIGVGEATVPIIGEYLKFLELAEEDWMPRSEGSYKLGIQFLRWSTRPGRGVWFHPFWRRDDNDAEAEAAVERWLAGRDNVGETARVDELYLGTHLAASHVAPRSMRPPVQRLVANVPYAYHMRSTAFGDFLRSHCIARGVERRDEPVVRVVRSENAEKIEYIETPTARLGADLFIDCTGFRRLLIGTLDPGVVSYAEHLACNRACVTTIDHGGTRLANHTTVLAMRAGWRWEIPTTSRRAFGYVYSDHFVEPDQAEDELRRGLGPGFAGDVRHLRFESGRLVRPWVGNCAAIGLAGGFIEPLESTAIALIQVAVAKLFVADPFRAGIREREAYAALMAELYDSLRDFVSAHYCISDRMDTPFWRACVSELPRSTALTERLESWREDGQLAHPAASEVLFPRLSWLALFDGMGFWPQRRRRVPDSDELDQRMQATLLTTMRRAHDLNRALPDHHDYLKAQVR